MNDDFQPLKIERAAIIIELSDGTKMIYGITDPIKMSLAERFEFSRRAAGPPHMIKQTMTFSGTLLGGQVWTGDMPSETFEESDQRALSEGQRSLGPEV